MSTPTDPTAGEGLSEVEREELEAGAALFGWAGLDEAHAHLLAAVERIVAARVSAAATRARAEALREAADLLGTGPTMRWLYERESCDWWGDRPVRDWLRARADSLAPDTAGESA